MVLTVVKFRWKLWPNRLEECQWHIGLLAAVNTVQLRKEKKWILLWQIPAILRMLAGLEFLRLRDHFGAHETYTPGTYTVCLYVACSIHFS